MTPTVNFIIRHIGRMFLPIITYTNELTGSAGELYRGELHNDASDALARMQHIWDTNGTPKIAEFKENMLSA